MGRRSASSAANPVSEPKFPRFVQLSVEVGRVAMADDDLTPIACPGCQAPINIHQPDAQLPDRLLGTCEACKAWYLVDVLADEGEALVIHLPLAEAMQQALAGG